MAQTDLIEPEMDEQALEAFLDSLRKTVHSVSAVRSWWQEHKDEYNALVAPFEQFGMQAHIDVLWEIRDIVPLFDEILAPYLGQKPFAVLLPAGYEWTKRMQEIAFNEEEEQLWIKNRFAVHIRNSVKIVHHIWKGEIKLPHQSVKRQKKQNYTVPLKIVEFSYETNRKAIQKRVVFIGGIIASQVARHEDMYWYCSVRSKESLSIAESIEDAPHEYAKEFLVFSPYTQQKQKQSLYLKLEDTDIESLALHAIVQRHWSQFKHR